MTVCYPGKQMPKIRVPLWGEGEAADTLLILTICKHPLLLGAAAIRFCSSQCISKNSLKQACAKGELSRSLFLYYLRLSHIPLPLFSTEATTAAIKMQAASSTLPQQPCYGENGVWEGKE